MLVYGSHWEHCQHTHSLTYMHISYIYIYMGRYMCMYTYILYVLCVNFKIINIKQYVYLSLCQMILWYFSLPFPSIFVLIFLPPLQVKPHSTIFHYSLHITWIFLLTTKAYQTSNCPFLFSWFLCLLHTIYLYLKTWSWVKNFSWGRAYVSCFHGFVLHLSVYSFLRKNDSPLESMIPFFLYS